MPDPWYQLTIDLPEEQREVVESLMYDLGATGLEVRDREAPPMPGVRGPNAGEAIIVAYFQDESDAQSAQAALKDDYAEARVELAPVPMQDWSNNWKQLIKSIEVGDIWVGPPWDADKAPKGKMRLIIEPKMAFGTGDHPTTMLCLKAIDAFIPKHKGASVLDVGTGTGVLAIAAKKLGAARTVGIDNDAMSVELARENLEVNQTPDIEISGKTLEDIPGVFDLVLANILANTLIELAPLIAPKVGKRLVLAGVLVHQKDEVTAAFVNQGLRATGTETINEWIRLDFEASNA